VAESKEIFVSIIIPVYNVEKFLRRCIDSILNQTLKEIEVVLIDDGSPDHCGEICDEYAVADARVKVIHQKNIGTMAACRAGISVAMGKFIGFVDSDDWIEADMYGKMYHNIAENNADIVSCGVIYNGERKKNKQFLIDKKTIFETEAIQRYIVPNLLNYWLYENGIYGPYRVNKLFKAQLVKENLTYCDDRLRISEDMNLVLACTLDAEKIVFLDQCYYHYEWNANSASVSYTKNYFENNRILYDAFRRMAKEKNKNINQEIDLYYNAMLIAAIRNYAKAPFSISDKCKNLEKYCEDNPAKDVFHYKNYKKILKSFPLIFFIRRRWYWLLTLFVMKREIRKTIKEFFIEKFK
jgi:glycosyltransferase involved in cell wall biosynthesis